MPDAQTPTTDRTAPETSLERVTRLLREHPLVDGHNDLPWELRERVGGDLTRVDVVDLVRGEPSLCTDLPRLREGMV
ncbi:dipeptidase, partial [Bacillus thuringiensis]|nr:dipeptidase [Bacillus thuringiensis]